MFWQLGMMLLLALPSQQPGGDLSEKELARRKALEAVERSVEAMGGARFQKVRAIQSRGHSYFFKDGRLAGVAKYTDYTRLPDKSSFQLGEGNNRELTVFDLSASKGWRVEGKTDIKEVTPEEMRQFRLAAARSIENLLRERLQEPGMTFFYYGPGDVSGRDNLEAVEMIDAENDSVLIYFDLKTRLPARLEHSAADPRGNRHKHATEFYNWHSIAGVMTPLRQDNFVDGELSSQLFIDELTYDSPAALSDATYAEPRVKK